MIELNEWVSSMLGDRFIVNSEELPEGVIFEHAAIMGGANDNIAPLMGGQFRFTSYKTLYVRCAFGGESDRDKNEEFFSQLSRGIRYRTLRGDVPVGIGRSWKSVEPIGTAYLAYRGNESAVYALSLKVIYQE
jgi:hypothetical protein